MSICMLKLDLHSALSSAQIEKLRMRLQMNKLFGPVSDSSSSEDDEAFNRASSATVYGSRSPLRPAQGSSTSAPLGGQDNVEKRFKCARIRFDGKPCKFGYNLKWELRRHNIRSHKKKECGFVDEDGKTCPHFAATLGQMTNHYSAAHDEKEVRCLHCSYRAAWNSKLATHMIDAHSEETPFVCVSIDCGMAYATEAKLHHHLKSHSGNKYKCHLDECTAFYNNYHAYAMHLLVNHNQSSSFHLFKKGHTHSRKKRITLAYVHVAGLDKCPVCSLVLPSMHQTLRHIRLVHPSVGKGIVPCDEKTPHITCLECQQCIPFSSALPHSTRNCPAIVNPELRQLISQRPTSGHRQHRLILCRGCNGRSSTDAEPYKDHSSNPLKALMEYSSADMALGSDPVISSFFAQLHRTCRASGHVYMWMRCKIGAKYTLREFRQRILYVGKSTNMADRRMRYEYCHSSQNQQDANSQTRMLWREHSEALKEGETIVLVHVVADVCGRLERNFGKDAEVLETFVMYTLGLSTLYNKRYSLTKKLRVDYASYFRDSCKIGAYALYCTWRRCAATGSWPATMFERVHLSSPVVDEHVSSTEDETTSISVDSTSSSELTPQPGSSALFSSPTMRKRTSDVPVQSTVDYKRHLLEKITTGLAAVTNLQLLDQEVKLFCDKLNTLK